MKKLITFLAILTCAFATAQTPQYIDAGNTEVVGLTEKETDRVAVFDGDGKFGYLLKEAIAESIIVEDIAELEAYDGEATTLFVKDSLRGGMFNYEPTGLTVDDGVVFEATGKGSGYWQRQYNQADGLNVLWYGADPTGTNDNADIIESVIEDYRGKAGGKVFFPKGEYIVERMIGHVALSGPATEATIKGNFHLLGEDATIKMRSSTEIAAVFGFEVESANILIENMKFDGDSITNRGVYFRQISTGKATKLTFDNVDIGNIFIGQNNAISNGTAITAFGKFKTVTIINSYLHDIHSGDNITVGGIQVSGFDNEREVEKIYIENNILENIYRVDDTTNNEQDAIHVSSGPNKTSSATHSATISNNHFINCRGRNIKCQRQRVLIQGNSFVFEEDFITSDVVNNPYINVQYNDAQIINNSFTFNNTNEVASTIIGITADPGDLSNNRNLVKGNKVYADFKIPRFSAIYERIDAKFTGNIVYEDNIVNAAVEDFIRMPFPFSTSQPGTRYLKLKNNTVNSVSNIFINNPQEAEIDIEAQGNINFGTDVNISNSYENLLMINNVGFLEENSYVLTSQLSTVATSGDYDDLTNKPTIPAQVNLIEGSNIDITGTYPNLTISATGGSGSVAWDEITGDQSDIDLSGFTNDLGYGTMAEEDADDYYNKAQVNDSLSNYLLTTEVRNEISDSLDVVDLQRVTENGSATTENITADTFISTNTGIVDDPGFQFESGSGMMETGGGNLGFVRAGNLIMNITDDALQPATSLTGAVDIGWDGIAEYRDIFITGGVHIDGETSDDFLLGDGTTTTLGTMADEDADDYYTAAQVNDTLSHYPLYEEGTFSPDIVGSVSGTVNIGTCNYTRIGNQVTVWVSKSFATAGLDGDITLTGLPYAAIDPTYGVVSHDDGDITYPVEDIRLSAVMSTGTNNVGFYFFPSDTLLTDDDLISNVVLVFQLTYLTNDPQ